MGENGKEPMMNPRLHRTPALPENRQQRVGKTEVLDLVYYDTLLFGAGQKLKAENKLFTDSERCNEHDLCNLKLQGHLTDNRQLAIYVCGLQLWSETDPKFYDYATYFSRFHLQMDESNKQILWGDQIGAGGGVSGWDNNPGAFHLNNGNTNADNGFRFREPIIITPGLSFEIIHKMMSTFEGSFDPRNAINGNTEDNRLMRFMMRGIEGRNPY
jgi:hypothetical protein